MPPEMHPMQSSHVAEVGHDGAALLIRYHGKNGSPGPLFRYPTAGPEHLEAFKKTDSPGRYFADRVKHFHRGERMDE